MNPIRLDEIAVAVGSRSIDRPIALSISSVSTDSRNIQQGDLFIAIVGDKFDGHAHLTQAASGGAVAAIVQSERIPAGVHPIPLLSVPDTRQALGKLACFVRKQCNGTVIGVAGSNGKTSTKHLIHATLSSKFRGSMSPKSYNNDIGVPLAIFPANPDDDYLVLELGTNHPGEIRNLTKIARPDLAIITNAGAEHLEFLGDLDGVRHENAQIIQGLSSEGYLIVNGDDEKLLKAIDTFSGDVATFGESSGCDLRASDIRCDAAGTRFKLAGAEWFVPLLGRHSAINALAAIAVGRRLGVDDADIRLGLSRAIAADGRLQLEKVGDISVLNDAYNANPHSMKAALMTQCALPTAGRRIAVLGDMRELGEWAEMYHRQIGALAAVSNLDMLYCVGELAGLIAEGAIAAGMPLAKVVRCSSAQECAMQLPGNLRDGDLVLLKGSRGIGLERVARHIVARDNVARASRT